MLFCAESPHSPFLSVPHQAAMLRASAGQERQVTLVSGFVCGGVLLAKSCAESHQPLSQAQSTASVADGADLSCTHRVDVQVEGSAAGGSSPGLWLQRVTSLISD